MPGGIMRALPFLRVRADPASFRFLSGCGI